MELVEEQQGRSLMGPKSLQISLSDRDKPLQDQTTYEGEALMKIKLSDDYVFFFLI